MQEVVVSAKRKINTGNYQNKEIMYSIKKQVLDGTELGPEMEKLSKEIKDVLDAKEFEIREEIEKEEKRRKGLLVKEIGKKGEQ